MGNVSYTNMVTQLSNPVMPDTILRPVAVGDTDTVVVTVDFSDCELSGARLYYGVFFDVSKDDMNHWSLPNPSAFFLRDDGLAGDAVAGNDVYSVGLTFNRSENNLNNEYYFRFYAIDCAPPNIQSDYLLDSVRVIQPGSLHQGGSVLNSEIGFRVLQAPKQHD
jgi:hypothetical protein